MLLLASIPLYLLKIEMIPREAAWLPSVVFVIFLAPARLLTGWAYAQSGRGELPRGCSLRFLSGVEDVGDVPAEGKRMIVVAAVNDAIHFRVFDRRGRIVVDTASTALTAKNGQIEGLRNQFDDSSPERKLTRREKRRTIKTISSIVGHTIPRHWIFRVLGRVAIVITAVFYTLVVFFAQYTSWGGTSSLYEQHAFLLPVPFFNM